jgi:hypothetical protein
MYGTLMEPFTCKYLISGKTSKFAAYFEIFNMKKSTLQNLADLTIDYLPTCIKVLQFSPISHRPYTHINFCSFVP